MKDTLVICLSLLLSIPMVLYADVSLYSSSTFYKKKPRWLFFYSYGYCSPAAVLKLFLIVSNISEEELSVNASILPSTGRRYSQNMKTFLVRKQKRERMSDFSDDHHVNWMTKLLVLCLFLIQLFLDILPFWRLSIRATFYPNLLW